MTLLPPSIPTYSAKSGIVDEKESEVNYVHNWLYSVVPAELQETYGGRYKMFAFLTGFCRECRKAFSAPIPHGNAYIETQMEVPVYGCVKPGTYR